MAGEGVEKSDHPAVSGTGLPAVYGLHEDLILRGTQSDGQADAGSVVVVFYTDEDPPLQLRQGGQLQRLPFLMTDGGLLVVLDPAAQTLDVEICPVRADLIGDGTLGQNGTQGRVCLIPGVFIPGIRVLVHAPFGPTGIFFLPGEDGAAQLRENGTGGNRRRRGAQEDGLRIFTVRDHIFQGALLVILVLLGLINDQQVKPLAQTALAGTGTKFYFSAAGKLNVLLSIGAIRRNDLYFCFCQQIKKSLPCGVCSCCAVRRVQDVLAMGQAPHLAYGHNLVFAVAAGHGIAELGVLPEHVFAGGNGHHVPEQQHLPLLGLPPGAVVQLYRFIPK